MVIFRGFFWRMTTAGILFFATAWSRDALTCQTLISGLRRYISFNWYHSSVSATKDIIRLILNRAPDSLNGLLTSGTAGVIRHWLSIAFGRWIYKFRCKLDWSMYPSLNTINPCHATANDSKQKIYTPNPISPKLWTKSLNESNPIKSAMK